MNRKAIILVNTGTPDSTGNAAVSRYLREFLGDGRVIDLPWLSRKILVNLIITPFRTPITARKYMQIWTPEGSPLKVYHTRLAEKLQVRAGSNFLVLAAMRYGNPSLGEALKMARERGATSVNVIPLYPHYSSATTGSVYEHVMKLVEKWPAIPEISFAGQFYSDETYLGAMTAKITKYDLEDYDHILFSYHGLPVRQVNMTHPGTDCASCSCDVEFPAHGNLCYRAAAYRTTRLLAARLNLAPGKYSTAFQSRFASKWLEPFTDEALKKLASKGSKNVLVVAPSFTADCLETLYEIGKEYRDMFVSLGGEKLDITESLNDDDRWVEALALMAGV